MIKILRKLYFTSLALALISTLLPSAMTMEEKNSQDLNLISIPKGFINDRSDELKELISFYINREELRNEISERAYQKTMAFHTYRHRLEKMLNQLDF